MDLYLHIGMPKTGTTSTQHFFASVLKDKSNQLLYPVFGRNRAKVAHHEIAIKVLDGSFEKQENAKLLTELFSGNTNILISSEAFTNGLSNRYFPEYLNFIRWCKRQNPHLNIHILITLIRIDIFFQSMYLHQVKTGEINMPFATYLSYREQWMPDILQSLAKLKSEVANIYKCKYQKGSDSMNALLHFIKDVEWEETEQRRMIMGRSPGLKEHIFLFHYPYFAEQLNLKSSRQQWGKAIMFQNFSLPKSIRRYSLFEGAMAQHLHKLAIKASLESGEDGYADFFQDDVIEELPTETLTIDHLNNEDFDLIMAQDSQWLGH